MRARRLAPLAALVVAGCLASKTDIALIYGGVAAMHTFRISRDERYANFFVRPNGIGERGMRVGVRLSSSP